MVELTDGEIKLTPIIAKPREAKAEKPDKPEKPEEAAQEPVAGKGKGES